MCTCVYVCVCRNTIIPEIQATAKAPSVVTMNKAIYLLYAQLAVTYIPAAFIGYACFGTSPHQDSGLISVCAYVGDAHRQSGSFLSVLVSVPAEGSLYMCLSVRLLALQFPMTTIAAPLEQSPCSSDMCNSVGFLKLFLTSWMDFLQNKCCCFCQ